MKRTVLSVLLIILSVLISSCATITARKITLTQFETGEVLRGTVNTLSGVVTITMPDGDVLQGKAQTQESRGIAYALLKSSTSKLMMELNVTLGDVSGFGEAQTNTGKRYRVQF
mgnify:CR=1 FL=1